MPTRTHDGIRKRCDCPVRRWPNRSHPWHFSFHFSGRQYRYSLDQVARAGRLMTHAAPHLRVLIVAALSTECRLGELLSLQWWHVRFDANNVPRWIALAAGRWSHQDQSIALDSDWPSPTRRAPDAALRARRRKACP